MGVHMNVLRPERFACVVWYPKMDAKRPHVMGAKRPQTPFEVIDI